MGSLLDFLSGDLGQTLVGVGGDIAGALIGRQGASDASDEYIKFLREAQGISAAGSERGREDIMAAAEPSLEDLITGFQGAIKMLEAPGSAEGGALALSGALGRDAEQGAIDNFLSSPGQDWLRNEQEQALLRNSAAIGGLGGGNVRTALQDQAYNRAATNMQQRFGNLSSLIMPEQQRNVNIANILNSGGSTLANYRTGVGTSLANLALGSANQQIPLITGTGAAKAAGVLGSSNALSSGISNVGKTLGSIYN